MAHLGKGTEVEGLAKVDWKRAGRRFIWGIGLMVLAISLPWLLNWTGKIPYPGGTSRPASSTGTGAEGRLPAAEPALTFASGETEKVIELKGGATPTQWVRLPENVKFRIIPPEHGCLVEFANGKKIFDRPDSVVRFDHPIDGVFRFWGEGMVKIIVQ